MCVGSLGCGKGATWPASSSSESDEDESSLSDRLGGGAGRMPACWAYWSER